MLQATNVVQPDTTSVFSKYGLTGLLTNTFGSRMYPVAYTYDPQGRVKTMKTWQNYAGNSGAATTTWSYDLYRGWLTNKTYDGGAAGPKYTYTGAGRLATRVWARGITTTYSYNGAGDLSAIGYSDGVTPAIGYSYDRRGRQAAITQGSTTTTRAYDNPGNLLSESYSGGPLNGVSVANIYDSLLRRATNNVLNGSTVLAQTRYAYDSASRLQTVTSGTNKAGYTYLANSPLVGQITFTNGSTVRMTTTKQYDNLNRLQSVSSSSASSTASSSYSYNTANQRTSVTNADAAHWVYQYDSLGQVTSGKKYWSDGTPVAGEQFEYNFDDIGNRVSTKAGGDQFGASLRSASYANNTLNQITSRDVPGYANILGAAATNAFVTVNNQPTYRKGEFFRKELGLDNTSASVWASVTNLAAVHTSTNDIVVTNAGSIFIPKTAEVFGYDLDGNTTNDGRWSITWDGENRAISFTSLSSGPSASRKKIDCTYDSQWRRTQKIVSTWNGSSYVAESTNRFVYDGWNLIGILNATNGIARSFIWGIDLSGAMQAAGGVGGLLIVNDQSTISNVPSGHFVAFDGNGNTAALVKASDGATSAQYEYGPFGELLRATGPMALANPIRFSAKYQDDESGFMYYGYRYYNPSTAKWLSRDSMEEGGGRNLFAFACNNPIYYVDRNGQDPFPSSGWPPNVPKPPPFDPCKAFDDWYKAQENPPAWANSLPNCPCTIKSTTKFCRTSKGGFSYTSLETSSEQNSGWYVDPIGGFVRTGPATQCIRSQPLQNGTRQECCYDKSGNLITTGPRVGTADHSSSILGHYSDDYLSVKWAEACDRKNNNGDCVQKYLKLRPVNNGNNCPQNDGT